MPRYYLGTLTFFDNKFVANYHLEKDILFGLSKVSTENKSICSILNFYAERDCNWNTFWIGNHKFIIDLNLNITIEENLPT